MFFVMRLATREVQIAGITPEPNGVWMKQMGRNLTDGLDGFLNRCRYLLHDRASVFTEEFGMVLQAAGIGSVRLPASSPHLNADAERFVRTIKEFCLERLILCGEASLRRATSEFLAHYHQERNHQGLENKIIWPEFTPLAEGGCDQMPETPGRIAAVLPPGSCLIGLCLRVFEFLDNTGWSDLLCGAVHRG